MTTIVTRAGKGSPLTHTEVDTNFTNLNTAKLETAAIPLGTLQAPSVSFLNDSDTGIFCPQGGNSLAIATGGQYAITCTSTQAVGIKTANPQKALHVAGPTRVGADDATDAFLEIGEGATGNRNSYIDIVADTTYTDYGLRIIRNNTGANATSELKHRGTGALNFTTQEAAPIEFYTTNSPRLTILAGGNVGIGTSGPSKLLNLAANDGNAAILLARSNSGAASLGQVGFSTVNGTVAGIDATAVSDSNNGTLRFWTTGGSPQTDVTSLNSSTPRMVITSAGLVGIGTTSPQSLLHLETDGTALRIVRGSAIGFIYNTGTAATDPFRIQSNGGSVELYSAASQPITFSVGGSTKATIDSSGRLLVGTSTSITALTKTIELHGAGDGASVPAYQIYAYPGTANTSAGHFDFFRSASSTLGANTLVGIDDRLGQTRFFGADGSTYIEAARIAAEVDGTPGANDMPGRLVFSTTADGASSPTERVRINSSGGFKASDTGTYTGSTTAYHEFYQTTNVIGLFIRGTNASQTSSILEINGDRTTTNASYNLIDAYNGNVSGRFSVRDSGNAVNTNNSYGAISDIKLKENIVDANSQWDDLKALQVRNYNFKEGQTHTQIGLVAQEAELVSPGLVSESPDRDKEGNDLGTVTKSVNYSVLYMKAVKALQEAMERIEALEASNADILARLSALEGN